MNKPFLPPDYQAPKNVGGGAYMKLQDGANKFRILSEAVTGYEYWTNENKCVRQRQPFLVPNPVGIRTGKDGKPERVKHFWAFVVWNYSDEAVEILEITQSTIRDQIHEYYKLEEYGEPVGYDINISRKGEGLDTEYTVQAMPPKPMAGNIQKAYEEKTVNLDALFDGGNPFEEGDVKEPTIEEVFDAQTEENDIMRDAQGKLIPPKSIKRG